MTLLKRDSNMHILRGMLRLSFGTAILQSSSEVLVFMCLVSQIITSSEGCSWKAVEVQLDKYWHCFRAIYFFSSNADDLWYSKFYCHIINLLPRFSYETKCKSSHIDCAHTDCSFFPYSLQLLLSLLTFS